LQPRRLSSALMSLTWLCIHVVKREYFDENVSTTERYGKPPIPFTKQIPLALALIVNWAKFFSFPFDCWKTNSLRSEQRIRSETSPGECGVNRTSTSLEDRGGRMSSVGENWRSLWPAICESLWFEIESQTRLNQVSSSRHNPWLKCR
jgi:hypothetical protein